MKKTIAATIVAAGCFATALGLAWFGAREAREAHAALTGLLGKRAVLDAKIGGVEDRITRLDRNRAQLEATLKGLQMDQAAASTADNAASLPALTRVLAANPKIFALWVNSYRAGLPRRFGPLYEELHLSRDQIDKFEDLMTSSAEDAADLRAIALSQGLQDSDPAIAPLQQWNDDQLRGAQMTLLGESGYQQLQLFNREEPLQGIISGISRFAALSPTPLTSAQAGQLLGVLANADGQYQNGGPADSDLTKINWDQALAQASGILPSSQFAGLKIEAELVRTAKLVNQFFQRQPEEK